MKMKSATALRFLLKTAINIYRDKYKPGQDEDDMVVSPQLALLDENGLSGFVDPTQVNSLFQSDREKSLIPIIVERLLEQYTGVVLISETFIVESTPEEVDKIKVQPSEHPQRQQALMLILYERGHKQTMLSQKVAKGKTVGKPSKFDDGSVGGLLSLTR